MSPHSFPNRTTGHFPNIAFAALRGVGTAHGASQASADALDTGLPSAWVSVRHPHYRRILRRRQMIEPAHMDDDARTGVRA